ncbi:pyrimidine 5'-nucleotidase [Alphaproteobacteria bacterium]|nr:pyrimidine 5'-nucleotidase [Alphaproteobacteria bacterium]
MMDFSGIDTWIFDVDETLYPHGSPLGGMIAARLAEFAATEPGLGALSATEREELCARYSSAYGTMLRALRTLHPSLDLAAFVPTITRIDYGVLAPDARLRAALEALPGRRLLATNAPRAHAGAVVRALGLDGVFQGVQSVDSYPDFVSKPAAEYYRRFARDFGVEPSATVMFDDSLKNLAAPAILGWRTALVNDNLLELLPPAG